MEIILAEGDIIMIYRIFYQMSGYIDIEAESEEEAEEILNRTSDSELAENCSFDWVQNIEKQD